ncbi:MAG: hypothetical protein ACOX6Y_02380 [Christensenellales bacterium]
MANSATRCRWASSTSPAKFEETDAVLGGEASGGLTVRGHIRGKDSVYAAAHFGGGSVCAKEKPL